MSDTHGINIQCGCFRNCNVLMKGRILGKPALPAFLKLHHGLGIVSYLQGRIICERGKVNLYVSANQSFLLWKLWCTTGGGSIWRSPLKWSGWVTVCSTTLKWSSWLMRCLPSPRQLLTTNDWPQGGAICPPWPGAGARTTCSLQNPSFRKSVFFLKTFF